MSAVRGLANRALESLRLSGFSKARRKDGPSGLCSTITSSVLERHLRHEADPHLAESHHDSSSGQPPPSARIVRESSRHPGPAWAPVHPHGSGWDRRARQCLTVSIRASVTIASLTAVCRCVHASSNAPTPIWSPRGCEAPARREVSARRRGRRSGRFRHRPLARRRTRSATGT